jgi:general nucleoside transport system permease protein
MDMLVSMLDATFRVATPLVLAGLAGLFSERAGVVDIGLEGKMLAAAFAGGAVAFILADPWLGLLAAMLTALGLSMVHAFACVTHNGNQMVSGMAINIIAAGITPTLASAWFHEGGRTPILPTEGRFRPINLPLAETLQDVPILGRLYSDVISGHTAPVYLAALVVPLVAYILYKTRFGLRLRAVGDNPHALDTAGVSVSRTRYLALACNGLLCGMAGGYLSIAQSSGFLQDMTAGKGYLALAALIFGKWKPWPTLFACLLFAFTDALQVRLQGVPLPIIGEVSVQFIQAVPYILTVLLLAGFVGKAVAPKAIGLPYVKSR